MKIEVVTSADNNPVAEFFSSSSTPETDAAWSCFKGYMEPLQDVKDLSRKLERERDEAIRQRDETNESSVFSCNFYYEEKLKAERERDEARELAQQMSDSNQVLLADVRFYRNAWEQIKEAGK